MKTVASSNQRVYANQHQSRPNTIQKTPRNQSQSLRETVSDSGVKQASIDSHENGINGDCLRGIDLGNHAGVVIVDYLPEASVNVAGSVREAGEASSEADDGFRQVMTKKKRKEMRAAAAAAHLVNSGNRKATGSYDNSRSRRVSLNSDSKPKHCNSTNQERSSIGNETFLIFI